MKLIRKRNNGIRFLLWVIHKQVNMHRLFFLKYKKCIEITNFFQKVR